MKWFKNTSHVSNEPIGFVRVPPKIEPIREDQVHRNIWDNIEID